jgi:L-glutamine:2-deoxy-scyllo-inosose/3-amino-2,3-dideoxy-scyllo-inosose aminotransferase
MAKLAVLGGTAVGALNIPGWPIFDHTEEQAVVEVVRSGHWAYEGPREMAFENAFAKYADAPHAISVTNGTHTLRLALEALGIGPGDEVIIPGSTWQATASSVLDVNATPILVDIDINTLTMDPKAAEAAVTSKTRAMIPVHLYGRMCDMDAIMDIAARYNLYVVEDCAHQHGSRWRGVNAGVVGDAGSFSLQSSKLLNTGEGGLIITKDDRLNAFIRSMRTCGRPYRNGWPTMQSGNYRATEFQAAIGLCQLARLDGQNQLREKNAAQLEREASAIGGIDPLYRHPGITFQTYYNWSLAYDGRQWGDVDKWSFMRAVGAELEFSAQLMSTFMPLHHSKLYRPLSKKTHKLSEDYAKMINPNQFDLPMCDRAYEDVAVNFDHTVLLMDVENNRRIIDAFAKVKENIDELRLFAKDYTHIDGE